jgi:hypothetical protein
MLDVDIDRQFADHQLLGNLAIAESVCYQASDLALAGVERVGHRSASWSTCRGSLALVLERHGAFMGGLHVYFLQLRNRAIDMLQRS